MYFKETLPFKLTKNIREPWSYEIPEIVDPLGESVEVTAEFNASYISWDNLKFEILEDATGEQIGEV